MPYVISRVIEVEEKELAQANKTRNALARRLSHFKRQQSPYAIGDCDCKDTKEYCRWLDEKTVFEEILRVLGMLEEQSWLLSGLKRRLGRSLRRNVED